MYLLGRIESLLRRTGTRPTRFGREAARVHSFAVQGDAEPRYCFTDNDNGWELRDLLRPGP